MSDYAKAWETNLCYMFMGAKKTPEVRQRLARVKLAIDLDTKLSTVERAQLHELLDSWSES